MSDGGPYRPLVAELADDVFDALRGVLEGAIAKAQEPAPIPRSMASRLNEQINGWLGPALCESFGFDEIRSWRNVSDTTLRIMARRANVWRHGRCYEDTLEDARYPICVVRDVLLRIADGF